MSSRDDATSSARPDDPAYRNGGRLAAIVESAFDAIISKTLDGEITSWNRAAEQLYGYAAEEVIGQPISIIVPDDKRHELDGIFRSLSRGERIEPFETCRVTKDGRRLEVSLTISPIIDDGGRVVGASTIGRDITDRKRDQMRLETVHAVTRILAEAPSLAEASTALLKTVTAGIECELGELWVHDEKRNVLIRHDSVVIRSNADLEAFDGQSRGYECASGEGLPGRVWQTQCAAWMADISDDSDFARAAPARAAGFRSVMAFPLGTADAFTGVLTFFSTRRAEPDEALLDTMTAFGTEIGLYIRHMRINAENANLASIIESSSDAIFGWSTDGIITSWNPQAERIFGHPAERMIGRSVLEIIPEDQFRRAKRVFNRLVRGEPTHALGEISMQNQGRDIRLSLKFSPIKDHTGTLIGFSTIARDVGDQWKVEDALRRAKEDAERASRAKSEFLATMSHEIRTPLNGVLATADMLLTTNLTRDQRDYLEILRDSGEQLGHLLNDLLDLSKIEAGHIGLKERDFNLRDLLDCLTTAWETRARSKGLEFFVTIQPALPLRLRGDDCRIRQVLENLISNAIKYTELGYVAIRVSADRIANDRAFLRLAVKDTGIGIEPDVQSRLFRRFERGEVTPEDMPEGSGLGLAICKEIVDRMGGKIGVDSNPERGSTFWFTVPMKMATIRTCEPARPIGRTPTATEPSPRSFLRVLVADDNATNRKLLVDILSSAGHTVDVAADGVEAVEAARQVRYDLIFMDMSMPEMDGMAAAHEIQLQNTGDETVPIVAVTANAMQGDREKYLEAGLTDYISKPFTMHDVLTAVNSAVGSPRAKIRPN